ncbi:MAG: hypothetical protein KBA75_02500 [Alphaproteobacteria bacterium]|nr:hypothetical protein [Alphaproteobacteria bacterium]
MAQSGWKQAAFGIVTALAVQTNTAAAEPTMSAAKDPTAQLAQALTRDLKTIVAYQEGQGTRANCVAAEHRIELAEITSRGNTVESNMVSVTTARMREGASPVEGMTLGPICPVVKPQVKSAALKR